MMASLATDTSTDIKLSNYVDDLILADKELCKYSGGEWELAEKSEQDKAWEYCKKMYNNNFEVYWGQKITALKNKGFSEEDIESRKEIVEMIWNGDSTDIILKIASQYGLIGAVLSGLLTTLYVLTKKKR